MSNAERERKWLMADDNKTKEGVDLLRDLYGQLEDAAREAGERMAEFLEEAEIKRRLSDAVDAVDDVRLEILRRLRDEPEPEVFKDMTVRELHELAGKADVPGRSSMNKAELIAALEE